MRNKRKNVMKASSWILISILLLSWFYLIFIEGGDFSVLFIKSNLQHAKEFITGILGFINDGLEVKTVNNLFELTLETIQISILAIIFSTIGMILTVVPAARNVAEGSLSLRKSKLGLLRFYVIRGLYMCTRAIPELIWALLIIFIFKPGMLAGAIALGIHNFGVLGKLCAEVVENLDERPIKSLISNGGNRMQVLFYGIIPQVVPKFITFIVYRWEIILRTTIIVGFIGAGGLGQAFRLAMSYFNYKEVGWILLIYILLVFMADMISGLTRKVSQYELSE